MEMVCCSPKIEDYLITWTEIGFDRGVAVGPSLGLTMSGYEEYGLEENKVNVNGLVSPVYIINGVVKTIPLIGKVLGGIKGSFGVSYTVKGNSRNPTVLVILYHSNSRV